MVCKITTVGLAWHFTIIFNNIMETSTNPVALQKLRSSEMAYQIVNTANILAYQGFDLVEDQNSKRDKRQLDVSYSMISDSSEEYDDSWYIEDDSDTDSDSSSDNVSKSKKDRGYGLCHNCSITYNQISQVQHINHIVPQTNQLLPTTIATVNDTTAMPNVPNVPQPKKSESTQGTTVDEMTNPNKIPPTMVEPLVDPTTQMSKQAEVITTETPKDSEASKQELASTTVNNNAAAAVVNSESSTTLEPATAAVMTDSTAAANEKTAETTEAAAAE